MIRQLHGNWIALATWVAFFAAFALETYLDWSLRVADGNVHDGGLTRSTWFALHTVFAMAALSGLVFAARRLKWSLAILVVSLQLAVGAVLYVFACLAYGIGSGIDHF